MIEKQQATVFYAPKAGRRYFTKSAAIKAEAKAIIYAKYPRESFEPDTGYSFDIETDCPKRYAIMFRRMCRLVKRSC